MNRTHPCRGIPAGTCRFEISAMFMYCPRCRGAHLAQTEAAEARVAHRLELDELTQHINLHQHYRDAKADFDRAYVIAVLTATRGHVTLAAEYAGKDRSDFYDLMRRVDIDPKDYRVAKVPGAPRVSPAARAFKVAKALEASDADNPSVRVFWVLREGDWNWTCSQDVHQL